MLKGNTEDTGVGGETMMGVNLVKAEKVKRRRLSFKEHLAFVWTFAMMGVVALGLGIAIVVVNVIKNQEEAEVQEIGLSEHDVKQAVKECMNGNSDDVGVSIECINNISETPLEETLTDVDDNVSNIAYGSAVEYALEYGEYINAANLMVAEATQWMNAGQCCKARALMQSDLIDSLTNQAKVVLYSGAVGIAEACDYNEELEYWSALLLEAKEKASEEFAASRN